MSPVVVLSAFAVFDGAATSLGAGSAGGEPGLGAYRSLLSHPGFWPAYCFSLWVAAASTVLAVTGAATVGFVWSRWPGRRRRIPLRVLQLTVSLPHLVWAVALAATFSQSGWAARIVASLGIIERPDQFPVLVNDRHGIGIIVHLVSKELPFLLLASLPLAGRRLDPQLRQAATLGASPLAQFRHIYVPAVAPVLLPAGLAAFAFALGGYEPAAVLGVQQPRTLAIVAVERFRDPDLARRADAFALSAVLLATTLVVALAAWALTRRWFAPSSRGRR